ncbi:nuclear transport factor 2 family protein [Pseudomonas sp. SA3-5]|uniref:Nuclear transport factor 2 family protein n=1 Tax=Pseudomonas aestuarii TaxID=3018340 RepID=A0ABT4XCB7_9PSED|nr:nuclear transport factor 2 family protein [Pseudomonas aestuarii]MDA7085861.1 nuclear transport factor 2 family protein [Pseudomonas aestuarii]
MTSAPNTTAVLAVPPAVAEALDKWHAMIAAGDLSGLPTLLHPQAVFRSPMAFKPYLGAPLVSLILGTVVKVFEDFQYQRQLASADGRDVVLEFAAKVAGRELKGIDMIRFDEQGKIVEFEVMIRPMSGLQVLGDEMARRLAPLLSGQVS